MIMGTTLFYAFLVVLSNLVVDIVYGFLDPRIKVGDGSYDGHSPDAAKVRHHRPPTISRPPRSLWRDAWIACSGTRPRSVGC